LMVCVGEIVAPVTVLKNETCNPLLELSSAPTQKLRLPIA